MENQNDRGVFHTVDMKGSVHTDLHTFTKSKEKSEIPLIQHEDC